MISNAAFTAPVDGLVGRAAVSSAVFLWIASGFMDVDVLGMMKSPADNLLISTREERPLDCRCGVSPSSFF